MLLTYMLRMRVALPYVRANQFNFRHIVQVKALLWTKANGFTSSCCFATG